MEFRERLCGGSLLLVIWRANEAVRTMLKIVTLTGSLSRVFTSRCLMRVLILYLRSEHVAPSHTRVGGVKDSERFEPEPLCELNRACLHSSSHSFPGSDVASCTSHTHLPQREEAGGRIMSGAAVLFIVPMSSRCLVA